MTSSSLPQLNDADWLNVIDLRDKLAAFHASEFDPTAAYLMSELQVMLEAQGGFVILAKKQPKLDPEIDPLLGWRPAHVSTSGARSAEQQEIVNRWMAEKQLLVDPITQTNLQLAGTGTRTHWMCDPAEIKRVEGTPTEQLNRLLGVTDRVWGATTIRPDVEVWCGATREGGDPFHIGHQALVQAVLASLRPVFRNWVLLFGLVGTRKPLSPRERQVLAGLLRGDPEKAIAADLGLKNGSLHQVVIAIYRKFGVGSRAALVSKWLQDSDAPPSPDAVTPDAGRPDGG